MKSGIRDGGIKLAFMRRDLCHMYVLWFCRFSVYRADLAEVLCSISLPVPWSKSAVMTLGVT